MFENCMLNYVNIIYKQFITVFKDTNLLMPIIDI
jgi:hypothetical protein